MISTDTILKMVSERHHQHQKNGLYAVDKINQCTTLSGKDQLLDAAALIVAELKQIECNQQSALCFLKYLP